MGFMHIDNLYKNQDILLFKEVYCLEKIHGTSCHISWKDGKLSFFSGGTTHSSFVALFDQEKLAKAFEELGFDEVVVFGEGYGGKEQGMSATYGNELKFIAFEVKLGENWLTVPQAEDIVVKRLGLEFVDYVRCSTDLEVLDAERDKPSTQAIRNGMGDDKAREGVVLRTLIEVKTNNGKRIVAKHKSDAFRETSKPRKVVAPEQLEILAEADAIALEWTTDERLRHVLDQLRADDATAVQIEGPQGTPLVIKTMVADILREAEGEIVPSKDAERAIGRRTAQLFKAHLQNALKGES